MVDELTKYGVVLESTTEPFDTANAAGKMMLQMLGVFAEFEHATIVERTRVGMERKAKSGRFVGGTIPYRYQLDPEKDLVIHEDEAVIVRKMFQMYSLGREGSHTICHRLNEAGHRKRNGKKWDRRVILHMIKNPLYVGKLRWGKVIYEGNHDGIVSEVLFEKAQKILKERTEDLIGRRFHNGDERLLAGIIRCARCDSHMVGVSTHKKDRKYPYYLCSKRWNIKDCDRDYVRADLLETAILQDIKGMFHDERFMARIWEEANLRLCAEKLSVDREIGNVETQIAKARATIDRYFEAFEAQTMKPEVCTKKVDDLNARIEELEAEKRDLGERRRRLEIPAIDQEMLSDLLDNFEGVMAEGTNPQKKNLLRRLVKKVLVHDKRTIEIWYALPNQVSVRTLEHLAPRMRQSTNRSSVAEPQVWFRLVHIAADGHHHALGGAYREQTVEIALGPKGAFKKGNVGAVTRRVVADRVFSAIPEPRGKPKPPKRPKMPRVVEFLRKAIEWQGLIESGQVRNQAEIARREGITRARVTQVMGLLRLAPEIQEHILSLPSTVCRSSISERALRHIAQNEDPKQQLAEFRCLSPVVAS